MSDIQGKIIYFVRHGESEANTKPVFQGPESPLTEKGREQAKIVAMRVAKIPFDALVASPFARARETAEAIALTTGKQPEYSELFVERLKPSRLRGKYGDEEVTPLYEAWEKSMITPGLRVEDGESYDDIVARADRALQFLKGRTENSIVVVTHGFFLRTLIARVIFEDSLTPEIFKRFHLRVMMDNTGISAIKYFSNFRGTAWRLWIHNDHAHLG